MSKFGRPSGKYTPHPLKVELERRGFTQQAAADYCGVSVSRMCHFLNGGGAAGHGDLGGQLEKMLKATGRYVMKIFPEDKNRIIISIAGMWMVVGLVIVLLYTQVTVLRTLNQATTSLRESEERLQCYALEVDRHSSTVLSLRGGLDATKQTERRLLRARVAELQPKLDPSTQGAIVTAVYEHCGSLSPSLIIHLMFRESAFDQMAVSSKDAVGLMQIRMSAHKDLLGKTSRHELFHISTNIEYGCKILARYMKESKTLTEALKKYVGGDHKGYIRDIYETMIEHEVGGR